MNTSYLLIATVLMLTFMSLISATEQINITVTVEGFRNDKGLCRLLIFEDKTGFPDKSNYALLNYSIHLKNKEAVFSFQLVPGLYAISVLHDENSNRRMDTTWYGKPKEGFGVSNNPSIINKSPDFNEAIVHINADNSEFIINLIYF